MRRFDDPFASPEGRLTTDDLPLDSCKPQLVSSLLAEIPREALEGKLLVSICAGVTIAQMKSMVPESTVVVRAMPNTPAKVRHSCSFVL